MATMTLDGQLMTFRTTWLCAMALAWSNEKFKRQLLTDPINALEQSFNFKWPWRQTIDFGVRDQAQFRWVGEDWAWPDDLSEEDELLLRLPLTPKMDLPNQALALADYYAVRPSIFGSSGGGGATPRGESLVTAAAVDLTKKPQISIRDYLISGSPIRFGNQEKPSDGFIPSAGSFLDFEVILLAALARAWDNKVFADLLKTDNVGVVLSSIRGYAEPWKLLLKIEDDMNASWAPTSEGRRSEWQSLKPHKITLNLPAPPDVSDQPIALAAYNSLGAQFPFTCCA